MKTFTAKEVMDALDVVVEGKENYTDPGSASPNSGGCKYVKNYAPSCIVGCALARLGVPIGVLIEMDGTWDPTISADGQLPLHDNGYAVTDVGLNMLKHAQIRQDAGDTWGMARDEARDWYENSL